MKLLMCRVCGDIFNLSYQLKQCSCGKVKGLYVNSRDAEVNGEGFSLAIGNGALENALRAVLTSEEGSREDFIEKGKITHCWVRPHTGLGNPHTIVNPDL